MSEEAIRRAARLAPLGVVLALLLLVGTGLRGLDFGFHWDEGLHLQGVRNSVERGVPLPGIYYYPGMSYWLSLASMAPALVATRAGGTAAQLAAISEPGQRLRTRAVFLGLSSLAVLFLHRLVLAWRGRPGEALLAASLLAVSWEYAYHARFIAPDGLVVSFGLASLWCAVEAVRHPAPGRWLAGAALAAGLACGAKWTAGLLVVPVVIAAVQAPSPAGSWLRRGAALVGLFAAAYLATTPGTIFEWETFLRYLELQQNRYAHGHPGHTVEAGPTHTLRILRYALAAFPSPHAAVSLGVAALAAIGALAMLRRDRPAALLLLCVPVLYVLYLSAYRVMIVRNLLLLGPFVCLLAARGAGVVWDALRPGAARAGLAALLAVGIGFQAVDLVRAADAILRSDADHAAALGARIGAAGAPPFVLSPGAAARLGRSPGRQGPGPGTPTAVFLASEAQAALGDRMPGNDPGLVREVIGPREVNFVYYTTWAGRDRLLLADLERARRLGFPFAMKRPAGRWAATSAGSGSAAQTQL